MQTVIINTGQTIILDDDCNLAKEHRFFKDKRRNIIYLSVAYTTESGKKVLRKLSNEVLGINNKILVKHINGSYLDFRKENLKEINRSTAHGKEKVAKNNKSGIKGVWWDPVNQKWSVRIRKDYKWYWGGRHVSKQEALDAYNALAEKLFGKENILKQEV